MTLGLYQTEYESANLTAPCRCGRHTQHRVFRALWAHPSCSRKDMASMLKLSTGSVRVAVHRLRRRDLSRTCPECMTESLLGGVCQHCGFEPDAPVLPLEIMADSQSPTNHIFPGAALGSVTDYDKLGFSKHGLILKSTVERGIEDSLIRSVKSDVLNELKRTFPDESVTDEAGRLVIKEVIEFRANYPKLEGAKLARAQLAENVLARLRLLHPQLRNVTVLRP